MEVFAVINIVSLVFILFESTELNLFKKRTISPLLGRSHLPNSHLLRPSGSGLKGRAQVWGLIHSVWVRAHLARTTPGLHCLDICVLGSHNKAELELCNLERPLQHCRYQCSICVFIQCQVSTYFVTLWHDLGVTFWGCWQIFRHPSFISGNLEEWQMVLGRVGTYYKMSAGSFITRWCPASKPCYQHRL